MAVLLRFFWFIPAVAAIIAAIGLWIEFMGLPHFAFRYTFTAASMHPMAERRYLSCEYVGPFGVSKEAAVDGYCSWFVWRTRHGLQ